MVLLVVGPAPLSLLHPSEGRTARLSLLQAVIAVPVSCLVGAKGTRRAEDEEESGGGPTGPTRGRAGPAIPPTSPTVVQVGLRSHCGSSGGSAWDSIKDAKEHWVEVVP